MHGQMFVEVLHPDRRRHPWPIVLIHGSGLTGTCWMTTPDGRPGWANRLLDDGWCVAVVDQPTRGRSALHPSLHGPLRVMSPEKVEFLFTASSKHLGWPGAENHTQWPGAGHRGDPQFDAFYASMVPYIPDAESEWLMRAAGAALLDRIGPAVLLTHSQAGAFGWLIADARPDLTQGIVAVEPVGPPRDAVDLRGGTAVSHAPARPFGVTIAPLEYSPPVSEKSPLEFEGFATDWAILGWRQATPARQLPNLKKIPTLVISAEASYHRMYDHLTVGFLRQAGVEVDHILLEDRDIYGNGHMMMLEKNSDQIVDVISGWLERQCSSIKR